MCASSEESQERTRKDKDKMTKAVLDEVVVAGNADMREMAFKNLEAAIAGFDRCAGMLDDRHPLAQTLIGLTQMAGRSLRAISLVPAMVVGGGNGSSEPGTALMRLPESEKGDEKEEPKQDTRKPWAVAHSKRKHYCIGREKGCKYGVHGNAIGRHQNNCVFAAQVRAEQAAEVLGDAVKLGTIEGDGAGQIVRLPDVGGKKGKKKTTKKAAAKKAKKAKKAKTESASTPASEAPAETKKDETKKAELMHCAGRTSGCEFSTSSGRWLARHQNICEHAKAAAIRGEGSSKKTKAKTTKTTKTTKTKVAKTKTRAKRKAG